MNLSLTSQKTSLLAVNFILGSILIYSYYHYITKSRVPIKKLWGKAFDLKHLYLISMVLAAIGYILVVVFSVFKTPNTKINNAIISNLMVIQVVIIVVSMLWMPMTLVYLKEKASRSYTMIAIVFILFIVALASAKQMIIVRNITPENNQCARYMKTAAIVGAGYFLFHTFAFDFLGWELGFFRKKM